MHFVSLSCGGEHCSVCDQPATHKLGEEIPRDDPSNLMQWQIAGLDGPREGHPMDLMRVRRHNLTAYVCCEHFTMIVGSASGCSTTAEATR